MKIISLLDLAVNWFPFRYPVDLASTVFVALVLAAFAALAVRTTATIIRRRKGRHVSISHFSLYNDEDDFSSCSSSDDEDEEDNDEESDEEISESEGEDNNESSRQEESNFWPEIGGAVVKAWDGLGLGFQRTTTNASSSGSLSLYDLSRSENLRCFLAEIPAAINFATSPSLLLSTTTSAVKVWDARSDWEAPVTASELPALRRRKMVGISGGDSGKVYVQDDTGELTAVDLRSSRPPATTWLVADEDAVDNNGSVVSWCRNAAKCLTLLPLSE